MDKEKITDGEIERRLKEHLQQQADQHKAPSDLWAKLEPKLSSPAPKRFSRTPWGMVASWYNARPVPALATAILLAVAITSAFVVTASPWDKPIPASQERNWSQPSAPTPAPTAASNFNAWGGTESKDSSGLQIFPSTGSGAIYDSSGKVIGAYPTSAPGPAGPAGPAGSSGSGYRSDLAQPPYGTPAPTATAAPRPAATPTPGPYGTQAPYPILPPGTPRPPDVPSDPSLQRMVVQNGMLSMVVDTASGAIDRISQIAIDMGGYVVSARTWQDGAHKAGSISIRVPSMAFPDAFRAVKGVALEVTQDEVSSQDVTGEYVDLASRLKNLEATEAQLLKIMGMATEINDVLTVQSQLTDIQGQIEQTKGRMQYLEGSSSTSLIQVSLKEAGLEVSIVTSVRQARIGDEIKFSPRISGWFVPDTYTWDFGDGTTSMEETPKHSYARTGKFDVTLTITDNKGNTSKSAIKEMVVVTAMEVTINGATARGRIGDEFRFGAQVLGGFAPYTYAWDFGDGQTSDEETPVHAYARSGKFDVTVTVTDDKNNTATQTKRSFVNVAAIEVAFDQSTTETEEGKAVQFKSAVSGGYAPISYLWNFGDGQTSQDRNPIHVYDKAGRYTVSLTVTDDKDNTGSRTSKELIMVKARPAFDLGKQMQNAVSALSSIGQGLLTGLVWLLVLVPLWAIVLALIVVTVVRVRRTS